MKRTFTNLIAALALLVFMTPSMAGWGQTRGTVTDVLNRELTGVNNGSTSYSNWEGKTSNSDAVWKGNSAGGNNAIQLRSTNNSGIITTASGGTVTKVTVTWNSSTQNGRTLNVYGKNSAYSAASDLYGNNAGTLIGTIVYGTSTELTITDSYAFIGMRSASDAMYLTKIDVTWEAGGSVTPTCATPTISPTAGAVTTGTEVTINCDTEGATIYYTMGTDPADPTTSSDEYDPDNKPVITTATTIKAMAVKDGYNNSEVASAEYTIMTPVPGYAIDFESNLDCYVDWDFTNIGIHTTGLTNGAHSGSAWGSNVNGSDNGVGTAIIETKEKVAYPDVFTCYISKESTNTTASSWKIQVSSNGSDWEDIATLTTMTQNTWTEFTGNIKAANKTNVYVRLCYSGSTAKRAVDDISLTIYTPAAVEEPSITVTSPFTISTSVSISCVTDGATIYYTTDGYDPTTNSSVYSEPFTINSTTTIKAKAVKGNDASTIASVTATKELAEPTVTINASGITNTNVYTGAAAGSLAATVTYNNAAITGATVTWSGNNDEVATINSITGAVTLVAAGSVTFTASYAGNSDYSAKTATYVMTVTNVDPSTPGTITTPYTVAQAIENTPSSGTSANVYIHGIVSRFHNTSIVGDGSNYRYYISDDGSSTGELLVYKGKGLNNVAFSNANDLLIGDEVVICGGLTMFSSAPEVAKDNYIVSLSRKVATPTFSPVAGAVVSGTSVTISTTTSGATIYYTTDGTEPTTSSTEYTGAITITSNTTLKAIAVKEGYTNSDVATATYTVATQVATPTFSPAGGTYTSVQSVTISCTTDGATIYYTTDGTEPTTSSTVYAGAIAVNSTMTIKAIAVKEGMVNSEVASASYTINIDYATLPFIWEGGTSAALVALNGVSAVGLGSDYAQQNAPYRVKMDGVGDYIQVKTDVQPVKVTIGVKMLGGGTTSKIKVQESEDGSVFNDVQEFEISGSQNDVLNLETTKSFDADTRYVKIIKSVHGSNIGVGPITIYTTATIPVNANNEIESDVTIGPGYIATITSETIIPNGKTLTVNGILVNSTAANLIIEDGGQLVTSIAVNATVQKNITSAATNWTTASDGWLFIASPINSTVDPNEAGLITDALGNTATSATATYDLYYLAPNTENGWKNYRKAAFNLTNGKGYLYASKEGFTPFEFAGTVKAYAATENVSVEAGWNLIGNPFTYNVYAGQNYYKMNELGTALASVTKGTEPIPPCTGIVVNAADAGNVIFSKNVPEGSANNGNLQMTLSQQVTTRGNASNATLDNAIVSFNEGCELEKFYFGEQDANIFIPQGNEEYAIVSAEAQGEMPVCFKAKADGQYTISVDAENVEMSYLHLIDNITGADVDLLANPSYTFNAKGDDYASRFKLVFSANNNVSNAENGNFAFISNGQIILNGVSNDATIQVIDMLGRVVSSQTVNGNSTHMAPTASGVYVLRLIDGTNVMTQKIVVK